jgi:hypothetical protein
VAFSKLLQLQGEVGNAVELSVRDVAEELADDGRRDRGPYGAVLESLHRDAHEPAALDDRHSAAARRDRRIHLQGEQALPASVREVVGGHLSADRGQLSELEPSDALVEAGSSTSRSARSETCETKVTRARYFRAAPLGRTSTNVWSLTTWAAVRMRPSAMTAPEPVTP